MIPQLSPTHSQHMLPKQHHNHQKKKKRSTTMLNPENKIQHT